MANANSILHQAGALVYRVRDAKLEVLLITSRVAGRWIIPKGNIDEGAEPSEAAKREAFEEAGIKGTVSGSLGTYTYFKKLSEKTYLAAVEVYLLKVREQLKKWPEKGQRKLSWMSAKKAVERIEEPGVVLLLRRVIELESALVKAAPKPHRDAARSMKGKKGKRLLRTSTGLDTGHRVDRTR